MKKATLIILAVFFLVLGGIGGYFFISLRQKNTALTGTNQLNQDKDTLKADSTYKDESGFSFGYPKGIKVSDITPDTDEYYSQLKLAKGSEFITVSVKDGKTTGYEKQSPVGAVSLGGLSAKQYTSGGKLITVALDQGVLYIIEGPASPSQGGPKDNGFWEEAQGVVVSSFKLETQKSNTSGTTSGDNAIYEEEEVIE